MRARSLGAVSRACGSWDGFLVLLSALETAPRPSVPNKTLLNQVLIVVRAAQAIFVSSSCGEEYEHWKFIERN